MADVDDASIEDYDIADEDSGSSIDRYKGSTSAILSPPSITITGHHQLTIYI